MTDSSLAPHQLSEAAPAVLDHVGPLREVLGQLARLVDQLDDTAYNTTPVTTYGGRLGGHSAATRRWPSCPKTSANWR